MNFAVSRMRLRGIYVVIFVFVLLLLAPRLILLTNASRVEHIADTYTGETLALGASVQSGKLTEFLLDVHKYPLLGPYLSAPVVGAYYIYGKLIGRFDSPNDLMRAYVLQETNISLLFRIQALSFNLLALLLLYLSSRIVADGSRVRQYLPLLFATLSFYVTVFSVSSRIHTLAFLFSSLTLYLSICYYRKVTLARLLLAFGSAGLAFAASQSGLAAVALPVAALYFAEKKADTPWKQIIVKLVGGLVLFAVSAVLIGYPGAIFSFWENGQFTHFFLSPEHSQPTLSFFGFLFLVRDLSLAGELMMLWPIIITAVLFCVRKSIKLDSVDWIAIFHIFSFVLIFGTTSVTVGRFSLAILPSLFFLSGRVASRLWDQRWFVVPLSAFALISLFVIVQLGRVALGGDTRALIASYIQEHTTSAERILSTIDYHILELLPSVETRGLVAGTLGEKDKYVVEHGLKTTLARDVHTWDPKQEPLIDMAPFRIVVVGKQDITEELRTRLKDGGLSQIVEFTPYRFADNTRVDDFNWDLSEKSSVFGLWYLYRVCPPMYIFSRTNT